MVQRWMPDPFLFAVLLTIITYGLALIAGPKGPLELVGAWYGGIWKILEFAIQMTLVLVAGYTLAQAPAVRRGLTAIAGVAKTPARAVAMTVLVAMAAAFLNWGFGLVCSALLAREMARRVRGLDFGLVVAAAYSGFVVWASGLSSSIAIISATHGSKMNFIEQQTGQVVPLSQTLWTAYNLVPCLVLAVVLPILFARLRPTEVREASREALDEAERAETELPELASTPASRLERSPVLTILLIAGAIAYVVHR